MKNSENVSSYEESYIQQSSELFDQQITNGQQFQNPQYTNTLQHIQNMQEYYLMNIQMITNNNQLLIQLYNQNSNNIVIQQQIVQEYQKNELLLQRYSEELYKISDSSDTCYSSACLLIRPFAYN